MRLQSKRKGNTFHIEIQNLLKSYKSLLAEMHKLALSSQDQCRNIMQERLYLLLDLGKEQKVLKTMSFKMLKGRPKNYKHYLKSQSIK